MNLHVKSFSIEEKAKRKYFILNLNNNFCFHGLSAQVLKINLLK